MKYVFHNYLRQLISVCFLLNPEIPVFLHCKHFPSLLINLSYVNEARVVAQLLFSGCYQRPYLRETADKGTHQKWSFDSAESLKWARIGENFADCWSSCAERLPTCSVETQTLLIRARPTDGHEPHPLLTTTLSPGHTWIIVIQVKLFSWKVVYPLWRSLFNAVFLFKMKAKGKEQGSRKSGISL